MAISSYPRPGHPIAPNLLEPFLSDFGVPLASMDSTAWQRFDKEFCLVLGERIIKHLTPRIGHIKSKLGFKRISPLKADLGLDDLELEVRTHNCLTRFQSAQADLAHVLPHRAGESSNGGIGGLTIRDVLGIRGFGAKSLVDLLTSIQASENHLVAVNDERCEQKRISDSASKGQAVEVDAARALLELLSKEPAIPDSALAYKVPPLPPNVRITDLALRCRTMKILNREGYGKDLTLLAGTTIGALIELRGFGRGCVLDLLDSVCRLRESASWHVSADEPNLPEVSDILEVICSTPGISQIGQSDPRLGNILRETDASVTLIGELIEHGNKSRMAVHLSAVRELRDAVERCQSLSVEAELVDIIVSKNATPRNKELLGEHYGFFGNKPSTLQEIGEKHQISRERARQICAPTRIAKLASAPFAPALDLALTIIQEQLPNSALHIQRILENRGLVARGTTLRAIAHVGDLLQRAIDFECIGSGRKEFVVAKADLDQVKQIRWIARKIASKFGAATVGDLLSRCHIDDADQKAVDFARNAISSIKGFCWLDEPEGWFRIESQGPDLLRRRIRKVLAICQEIAVGELRTAIRRDHRLQGRVPPKRIMLRLCQQFSEMTVDGERISANLQESPRSLMKGDEAILVGLLQTNGPVCRREDLYELAESAGVSHPSFWRCISFCPTISRYAPGVYGLTGASVAPGVIESLIPPRRATRVIQDHGWTPQGAIWITYRVSESSVESGVVGIPAAKRDSIQGQFSLSRSHGGPSIGTITVKGSAAWGLGPFLRRRGAEAGDCLLIVFNLLDRTAAISVGDDALLDQFIINAD